MQYEDNKGFCEDLTEGKFSFPVVHGVRADRSSRQILSRYRTPCMFSKADKQTYFRRRPHQSH